MFLFLHRLLKAVICAAWLGAAWLGWQQRERLLPAWDLVQLWVERDSKPDPSAVRLTGIATDVSGETSFHLRESSGAVWHCGLAGLSGVFPTNRLATAAEARLARETRTNLSSLIVGRPVTFDATVTSPLRAAIGTARCEGTNVNLTLVEQGRAQVDRTQIRSLPLMDQYALVAAERRARKAQWRRWSLDTSTDAGGTPR